MKHEELIKRLEVSCLGLDAVDPLRLLVDDVVAALRQLEQEMGKPIAWYDPSNGVVSTDRDCPLFTPLGQVWALFPKGEWVGLTDEEVDEIYTSVQLEVNDHWDNGGTTMMFPLTLYKAIEAKLKEKNT
jgi:hypothetical protein